MAKLAIIGNVEIVPGASEQFLPMLMAHRARCLADEPGTLQFEVLLPHEDAARVLIYEVYADDAAFAAHWNGASMNRIRAEAEGLILKITGTRCAIAE